MAKAYVRYIWYKIRSLPNEMHRQCSIDDTVEKKRTSYTFTTSETTTQPNDQTTERMKRQMDQPNESLLVVGVIDVKRTRYDTSQSEAKCRNVKEINKHRMNSIQRIKSNRNKEKSTNWIINWPAYLTSLPMRDAQKHLTYTHPLTCILYMNRDICTLYTYSHSYTFVCFLPSSRTLTLSLSQCFALRLSLFLVFAHPYRFSSQTHFIKSHV